MYTTLGFTCSAIEAKASLKSWSDPTARGRPGPVAATLAVCADCCWAAD
jgi:hypothetical protein